MSSSVIVTQYTNSISGNKYVGAVIQYCMYELLIYDFYNQLVMMHFTGGKAPKFAVFLFNSIQFNFIE